MIQFEIDNSLKSLEIYLDTRGVEELITYLNFIKDKHEHMHLIVGNELTGEKQNDCNISIDHVKLINID